MTDDLKREQLRQFFEALEPSELIQLLDDFGLALFQVFGVCPPNVLSTAAAH